MNILGVRVDNLEKGEILEKIEDFLAGNKLCQIATVNPEFILTAQKDAAFKNILNSCDLNIADGIGIKFAFWKLGEKLKCRMAGMDLMDEVLKIANDRGLSVFLAANKDGLSSYEEVSAAIKIRYPNIRIGGINLDKKISNYQFTIHNSENYKVIFCNFGHPHQEFFLNSQKGAIIGLVMGVGGSFDFWTGKLRRAPLWMRKIGLEWLFRLWKQPSRFLRIFKAVIIFPIKVIFFK
jgi:N-acetylglucosaminyldiphosphoundecaprenol N-acetyl-beta-D-mannosaminyltransferase